MGVGFFRKVKNFFGKVWNGVKKVVGAVAGPVIGIAKSVLPALSVLPGKIGAIGKIGTIALPAIEGITNKMRPILNS